MTPHVLKKILTGMGIFEDHYEVVRAVMPVQEPDDLRCAGSFVCQEGEGDLFWNGVWMIRLEHKRFLASVDEGIRCQHETFYIVKCTYN